MRKCYEFESYKDYLTSVEASRAHLQRGFRTKLAEALGIQNAYVSKVLNGNAHFNLEQGLLVCEFLKIEADEQQYFLWLIELARAGTKSLQMYFQKLLDELREKHLNIKEHVGQTRTLTSETQSIYYSHWYYAAIHALVSIPSHNTVESISRAFQMDRKKVEDVIVFLIQCGMLDQKEGKLVTGATQVHLERTSPNIGKHHINWRMKAIESLSSGDEFDTHYSTVSSLSNADVAKIRKLLVKVVQEYVETVRNSPEETLYSFSMDFFKIGRN